jgi:hypothetical protein
VPAQREDTVARGDFAKCITKHIDVWFAFARDLGLGVTRMEDIILVTGRDLATSWTNVVFSENQGGEQVSFGVQVSGTSDVQWQVSPEDVRGAAVNNGPSGKVRFSHLLSRDAETLTWIDMLILESARESVHIHQGVPRHPISQDNTKASRSGGANLGPRSG